MKKMVLGLFLALATLGFLVSPAMAADPPQAPRTVSAADQAFLASLAVPEAPVPAAKAPAVGQKALCNATANCGNGATVSCQGNNSTTSCSATDSSCPSTFGKVTCDGVTTWCSSPPTCNGCGSNFCTDQDESNCASSCFPCDYTFTCNATYCTERCRCIFQTCPV